MILLHTGGNQGKKWRAILMNLVIFLNYVSYYMFIT